MTAPQRERVGRCFADMVFESGQHHEGPNVSKIQRYTYTFVRSKDAPQVDEHGMATSLLNGHLSVGDAVTVSVEPDILAVARGFIVKLDPEFVEVGVDHEINLDALLARSDPATHYSATTAGTIFRIDKDEFMSGLGRLRDNLAHLYYEKGDTKRLSLVVDLAPPIFDESLMIPPEQMPTSLNASQQEALGKVFTAKDYALILGMPGTGKTTTIAEIIKLSVKQGKSVLLTSYTHSAVDTILMKLGEVDFQVLRLGNQDKVRGSTDMRWFSGVIDYDYLQIHKECLKYAISSLPTPKSIEELEHQVLSPPVVATTCLSIGQ